MDAIINSFLLVFISEMGDKTQLATVALGAKFAVPVMVTFGTTVGMLVTDGLAVICGHKFTERVPMKLVNRIASLLFILFGFGVLVGF